MDQAHQDRKMNEEEPLLFGVLLPPRVVVLKLCVFTASADSLCLIKITIPGNILVTYPDSDLED